MPRISPLRANALVARPPHTLFPALQLQKSRPSSRMKRASTMLCTSEAPSTSRAAAADKPDSLLDPDAIAESYMHLIHQPRSAWAWEIELRPWVEKF